MTEPISRPSTAEYSKDTSGNLTQESNLIHGVSNTFHHKLSRLIAGSIKTTIFIKQLFEHILAFLNMSFNY